MLIRLALRNLFRNPRRSLAITLTVATGCASILLFLGFNHGIMNQYRENTIHSRYGHGQVNLKGYREKVFEKPWEHWITDWASLSTELRAVPGVKQVFPRLEFFSLLTNGKITVSGRGQGIRGEEESRFFNTINIEEGTPLSNQPDGILLGRGLARALDVKIGDRVTALGTTVNGSMNAADLTVTGIFHTGAKEFDDAVFRVQLDQAQRLLDTDRVESILIGLEQDKAWTGVSRTLLARHPELETTPFNVLDEVYYQHSVDWLDSQFGVIQLIILAIVILGIFNSVSTGILERKQEIGNLRANGESVRQVMALLSSEGLALGLAGALLGVMVSYALEATLLRQGILMPPAPGLTRQFHVLIEFNAAMALWSLLLSSSVALLATLLAATKVARLPIAEALRAT